MLKKSFSTVHGKRIEIGRSDPKTTAETTLVFLHEGLGCTALWRNFPERLSTVTGCPAFVFSRFGYGDSDPFPLPWPIRFMHDEGLTILPKLLKAAEIGDYILIGHSDGGSIALIHAGGLAPDGLRGVITEAAHVFCEQLSVQSIQKAKADFLSSDLRKRLEKYHGRNTDNAFWGWNNVWLNPDFMNWNIERYLPYIQFRCWQSRGKTIIMGQASKLNQSFNKAVPVLKY